MLSVAGFFVLIDRLCAIASIAGTANDATGTPSAAADTGVPLPVRIRKATPTLLKLEFDPLPIEFLGVRAHQRQAALEITTRSGPGCSRSHLLQAIAHLHSDPGASLQQIAELLNQLLSPPL
jgi:hypothetical protein